MDGRIKTSGRRAAGEVAGLSEVAIVGVASRMAGLQSLLRDMRTGDLQAFSYRNVERSLSEGRHSRALAALAYLDIAYGSANPYTMHGVRKSEVSSRRAAIAGLIESHENETGLAVMPKKDSIGQLKVITEDGSAGMSCRFSFLKMTQPHALICNIPYSRNRNAIP